MLLQLRPQLCLWSLVQRAKWNHRYGRLYIHIYNMILKACASISAFASCKPNTSCWHDWSTSSKEAKKITKIIKIKKQHSHTAQENEANKLRTGCMLISKCSQQNSFFGILVFPWVCMVCAWECSWAKASRVGGRQWWESKACIFVLCMGASSFPCHRTRRVTTPTFSCSTGRSKDQVCWLACCEKVSGKK